MTEERFFEPVERGELVEAVDLAMAGHADDDARHNSVAAAAGDPGLPAPGERGRVLWMDDGRAFLDTGTAWVFAATADFGELENVPATFAPSEHGHETPVRHAAPAQDQYHFVARLPASTSSTNDRLEVEVLGGPSWGPTSTNNALDRVVMGNRSGFAFQYWRLGVSASRDQARIVAHRQADNSVDVYLRALAGSAVAVVLRAAGQGILDAAGNPLGGDGFATVEIGAASTVVPTGAVVFDSATTAPNGRIDAGDVLSFGVPANRKVGDNWGNGATPPSSYPQGLTAYYASEATTDWPLAATRYHVLTQKRDNNSALQRVAMAEGHREWVRRSVAGAWQPWSEVFVEGAGGDIHARGHSFWDGEDHPDVDGGADKSEGRVLALGPGGVLTTAAPGGVPDATDTAKGAVAYLDLPFRRKAEYADFAEDHVASGMGLTTSGLTATLAPGHLYAGGARVVLAGPLDLALTATSDNYVDADRDGGFAVTAVAVGAAAPVLPAGSVRLYRLTTGAAAVTAAQDLRRTFVVEKQTRKPMFKAVRNSTAVGFLSNTNYRVGLEVVQVDDMGVITAGDPGRGRASRAGRWLVMGGLLATAIGASATFDISLRHYLANGTLNRIVLLNREDKSGSSDYIGSVSYVFHGVAPNDYFELWCVCYGSSFNMSLGDATFLLGEWEGV